LIPGKNTMPVATYMYTDDQLPAGENNELLLLHFLPPVGQHCFTQQYQSQQQVMYTGLWH
jgi:hypothetical protein